jgi:hypothetical protein
MRRQNCTVRTLRSAQISAQTSWAISSTDIGHLHDHDVYGSRPPSLAGERRVYEEIASSTSESDILFECIQGIASSLEALGKCFGSGRRQKLRILQMSAVSRGDCG